jgi:hypothetical protein
MVWLLNTLLAAIRHTSANMAAMLVHLAYIPNVMRFLAGAGVTDGALLVASMILLFSSSK